MARDGEPLEVPGSRMQPRRRARRGRRGGGRALRVAPLPCKLRGVDTPRTSWALLGLILTSWALPQRAEACSCVSPPAPRVALQKSSAVFEGKVLSLDHKPELHRLTARIEVLRTWKDAATSPVEVSTHDFDSMCGFNFEVGRSYLIYADGSSDALSTALCSRSRESENAADDFKDLGPAKPSNAPAPAPTAAPAPAPAPQADPPASAPPPSSVPIATPPSPAPAPLRPSVSAGACAVFVAPGPNPALLAAIVLLAFQRRRPRRA